MVGRWTVPLAVANMLFNLAISVVACPSMTDSGLWDPQIVLRMEEALEISSGSLDAILGGVATAAIAAIVTLCVIDSAMGFLKGKNARLLDIPDEMRGWMGTER